MKKIFRACLASIKPLLEMAASTEASLAARWAKAAHKRLFRIQWKLPPQPEHFDHHIDLYYQWPDTRNSFWLERGVFGSLALKNGGKLLELACGDGFNARHFYSLRCQEVVACDFDETALATARRKNGAPNLTYVLADIRMAMPAGQFDNIVWDAAIEHFTPEEIDGVLRDICSRLKPTGVLSGYTIVEQSTGEKSLSHHEYEFKSKEDLLRFFTPRFAHVTVFETLHPTRHNLYFWASNGGLPFGANWEHACGHNRVG
jgi:SAM-dependent methyltransferase